MTYSILARDVASGEIGAACQSHFFNAGVHVIFAEPAVGAVAAQMMAERAYGTRGLASMRTGASASEALRAALEADPGAALRQVAMVDARGGAAAHTGASCVVHSAHQVGNGVSAQAAMCSSPDTPAAMLEAFEHSSGPLASRLLAALEAAEACGGDLRGQKAAAVIVVAAAASEQPWNDRHVDLRVEDHEQPLVELRRLISSHRFHSRANRALDLALAGRAPEALEEFAALERENQHDPDVALRHALVLALGGEAQRARRRLEMCYARHEGWRSVVERLPAAGLLPSDPALMAVLTGPSTDKPAFTTRA